MLTKPLEHAINTYLQLDPETPIKLGKLSGQVLAIQLGHMPYTLYLQFTYHKILVSTDYVGEVTATLIGTPYSLAKLTLADDQQVRQLFKEDIEIIGDIEFAEQVKDVLNGIDIDWEHYMSFVTGDIIAHQIGNFSRGVRAWHEGVIDNGWKNMAEYLQEELRCFPTREEVEDFFAETDELRMAVDRLEARVQHAYESRD